MNIEAGVPLSQHFSIHAQARINPWLFGLKEGQARYDDIMDLETAGFLKKKTEVSLSFRYWQWYVFSGLWMRGKVQFSSYDRGGRFLGVERRIGDAVGAGIGVGYTYMLSSNWNIELGVGVWGGMVSEATRENVLTPKTPDAAWRPFFLLDDVALSFVYVF